jgi:hypothetical protein
MTRVKFHLGVAQIGSISKRSDAENFIFRSEFEQMR